jgi:diguanylate cyclase (GGDEF)-like protein
MPELRNQLTVRRYCATVFVAGVGVIVAIASTSRVGDFARTHPLTFSLLAIGVLVGEMLPVIVPRRGGDEAITLSTCFSMALLVAGGLAPAVIAQGCASVLQDVLAQRQWWRIRFNLGQYVLSLAAAFIGLRALGVDLSVSSAHSFTSGELPAVLLGASLFFLVNSGVVGVAIALYQGVPLARYFRSDVLFVLVTGGTLLALSPIIVAAASFSALMLPLFAVPMLALYVAGKQATRSERAARHDSLTGLRNRAAFRDAVTDAIETHGGPSSVLLMDLDRFKEVNDTLGHRYGDLLLQEVAGRLHEQVDEEQCIARLGGDEFAILRCGVGPEEAERFAQEVADSLRTPFQLDEILVDVQASVGIAVFPRDGTDVETLLQKADVAMYRAKETSADVALYEERHDHHSPAKLALTGELRFAVESDQLVVWYQPELDLTSGQVLALEALVRWQHPDLGLLLPGSFIDTAEHTSLIKPLTRTVIDIALRQIAEWRTFDLDVAVAVNISTRMLVDAAFPDMVLAALDQADVAPSQLKLEVTESTLVADPVVARRVLQKLDSLGIEISIDDFGTGYSSLAYLADLPVSEIKIDRSFVSQMAAGSSEAIIVSSTVDLAHNLGLRAVAEGVEEPATLEQLAALGCDAAQGYAIGRPLDAQETTRYLLSTVSDAPADARRAA